MKISHISTSDSLGGSVSARRIHENLLKYGFDSNLFFGLKNSDVKKSFYLTQRPNLRKVDFFF